MKFFKKVIQSPILGPNGKPFMKVFPHTDPAFLFIARKVIRGLVHALNYETVVPDDHVAVREYIEPPEDVAHFLEDYYSVPGHFSSQGFLLDERFIEEFRREMHSYWHIRFFDLPLSCGVAHHRIDV